MTQSEDVDHTHANISMVKRQSGAWCPSRLVDIMDMAKYRWVFVAGGHGGTTHQGRRI